MFCLECGYSLVHLPEPRCPECGRPFDPTDQATFHVTTSRPIKPLPLIGLAVLSGILSGLSLLIPVIGFTYGPGLIFGAFVVWYLGKRLNAHMDYIGTAVALSPAAYLVAVLIPQTGVPGLAGLVGSLILSVGLYRLLFRPDKIRVIALMILGGTAAGVIFENILERSWSFPYLIAAFVIWQTSAALPFCLAKHRWPDAAH